MNPNMFCLCVAVAMLLVAQHEMGCQAAASCFRLSGAFNFQGHVYLVDGDDVIQIGPDFTEVYAGKLSTKFAGFEGELEAAIVDPADRKLYFFQGSNHFEYSSFSFGLAIDNSDWDAFFKGGIDAASDFGSKSYFFKGCKYRTGETGGQTADTSTLGLPCDLDAAWYANGKMYVTRGNNVWTMSSDGTVSPSQKLSDILTLTSATICDEAMNPFRAEIEARHAYEKEHGCVVIDAAITWYNDVYLFNNDKYISLDSKGKEKRVSDVSDWGGLAGDIEASIVWGGDDQTYFFKGPSYYKYNEVGLIYTAQGPISNDGGGAFYANGIDAAGTFNGVSYFFKGCQVQKLNQVTASGLVTFMTLTELGLPCDVDAAFSRGKNLHVIKWNQVWTWEAGKAKATGPADLSTVASISSWKVCPPS